MTRSERPDEPVKAVVQQYWNGRAESYDDDGISGVHADEQREAWLSVLRPWVGEGPQSVLDLGCGTGTLSVLLAAAGHDVTGIDLSPEMLGRAREKAQRAGLSIDFGVGDAEQLPVPENGYDVVTARHLIWTLPTPAAAVQEWRRVVRPGGRLVLVEGYWDFPEPFEGYETIHDDLPLYDGRPPAELAAFLREGGFDTVECEPLSEPVLWGEEPEQELYLVAVDVSE
ncbi:class I SAM-dependent methyltransferase [Natrialba taiwanensis]|uniref:Methyltransferase type 11 n=1 Tax=Natrialba taiwanensis DSM 12281 TaxID=1230458 RepID=M0ADD2_9EURY|nr:class I SAM-dependent methyltransferase [Natrialba taiwanensis]ELY95877.1 methyltransferase type 11 [Natrialba taiwanensis DSM 12281]